MSGGARARETRKARGVGGVTVGDLGRGAVKEIEGCERNKMNGRAGLMGYRPMHTVSAMKEDRAHVERKKRKRGAGRRNGWQAEIKRVRGAKFLPILSCAGKRGTTYRQQGNIATEQPISGQIYHPTSPLYTDKDERTLLTSFHEANSRLDRPIINCRTHHHPPIFCATTLSTRNRHLRIPHHSLPHSPHLFAVAPSSTLHKKRGNTPKDVPSIWKVNRTTANPHTRLRHSSRGACMPMQEYCAQSTPRSATTTWGI